MLSLNLSWHQRRPSGPLLVLLVLFLSVQEVYAQWNDSLRYIAGSNGSLDWNITVGKTLALAYEAPATATLYSINLYSLNASLAAGTDCSVELERNAYPNTNKTFVNKSYSFTAPKSLIFTNKPCTAINNTVGTRGYLILHRLGTTSSNTYDFSRTTLFTITTPYASSDPSTSSASEPSKVEEGYPGLSKIVIVASVLGGVGILSCIGCCVCYARCKPETSDGGVIGERRRAAKRQRGAAAAAAAGTQVVMDPVAGVPPMHTRRAAGEDGDSHEGSVVGEMLPGYKLSDLPPGYEHRGGTGRARTEDEHSETARGV